MTLRQDGESKMSSQTQTETIETVAASDGHVWRVEHQATGGYTVTHRRVGNRRATAQPGVAAAPQQRFVSAAAARIFAVSQRDAHEGRIAR